MQFTSLVGIRYWSKVSVGCFVSESWETNEISEIFHNFLGSGKGYGKDFFQPKKGYGKEKGFCQNPKKGKGKGKEILGIPERIMGFVMELWKKDP